MDEVQPRHEGYGQEGGADNRAIVPEQGIESRHVPQLAQSNS